jgi:hypothetical protein
MTLSMPRISSSAVKVKNAIQICGSVSISMEAVLGFRRSGRTGLKGGESRVRRAPGAGTIQGLACL